MRARGRRAKARARHQMFWGITSLVCTFLACALFFGGAIFADHGMRDEALVCWFATAAMMFCSLTAWIIGAEADRLT